MALFLEPDLLDFLKSFNACSVRYIVVGGVSVILNGYVRTTVDLDIWVDRTKENYKNICKAFSVFGMPLFDMTPENFFDNPDIDTFTFGRPPECIDLMLAVKGLQFGKCYANSKKVELDGTFARVLSKNDLIVAKLAAGRHKDLDDVEHLKGMDS